MSRSRSIIVINENYQQLAKTFYQYLLKVGHSPESSRSRFHYLNEFLHWLEQKGELDITKITSLQLQQYYAYISERPSRQDGNILNPKTTHSHMRNVRDFFEMLLKEGRLKSNPSSALHFPYPNQSDSYRTRTILTQSEIKELYEACETAQERAILSLAYGCGLRASELEKCNIKDVRLKDKLLIVPEGKNKKRRVVPMSKGVAKDLGDYFYLERDRLKMGRAFKLYDADNRFAFMLHHQGGRMRKWTYNKYLKAIIDRSENQNIKDKQISLHNLRHSIATHLLEQGVAIEQVRLFLGHSQLETTQIYTRISREQINQLIQ